MFSQVTNVSGLTLGGVVPKLTVLAGVKYNWSLLATALLNSSKTVWKILAKNEQNITQRKQKIEQINPLSR